MEGYKDRSHKVLGSSSHRPQLFRDYKGIATMPLRRMRRYLEKCLITIREAVEITRSLSSNRS
jgi:hypothetical protein